MDNRKAVRRVRQPKKAWFSVRPDGVVPKIHMRMTPLERASICAYCNDLGWDSDSDYWRFLTAGKIYDRLKSLRKMDCRNSELEARLQELRESMLKLAERNPRAGSEENRYKAAY